jgi:hypothetical protein
MKKSKESFFLTTAVYLLLYRQMIDKQKAGRF